MQTRNSRWMKWVLEEASREIPSLPFERGTRREWIILRHANDAQRPPLQTPAPIRDRALH